MMEHDKKLLKVVSYLLTIFLALLFCGLLFKGKIFSQQDLIFHLNRLNGLKDVMAEGQFLPKIYPYANYAFGYASPLFYCDLFLYPFAGLLFLNVPIVTAYRLMIIFYTVIGAILTQYVVMKIGKDQIIALLGVILYLFANYHFLNVHFRSALGEILAYTWLPLVLYVFYRIFVEKKDAWIMLGISFSLLVMSHLITTLLCGILLVLLMVIFMLTERNKEDILRLIMTVIKGALLASVLCAWYLLPMLEQLFDQNFYLSANQNPGVLKDTAVNIGSFFAFGTFNEAFDIISDANIGLIYYLLLLPYIFVKKDKRINILLILTGLLSLMIMGIIPLPLGVIQFLFRLYLITLPLMICVILYNAINLNGKYRIAILIIVALVGAYQLGNTVTFLKDHGQAYDDKMPLNVLNAIDNADYDLDYDHATLGGAEYLPHTTALDYAHDSLAIKTIGDDSLVDYTSDYQRSYTTIEMEYHDEVQRELLFPLTYYKGYKAYELIDGKWIMIPLGNHPTFRLVAIEAQAGKHIYKVTYDGTMLQKLSLAGSLCGFIILAIYSIINGIRVKNGKISRLDTLL